MIAEAERRAIAAEAPDEVVEERISVDGMAETFIATLRRVGIEPFKAAANAARFTEKQVA